MQASVPQSFKATTETDSLFFFFFAGVSFDAGKKKINKNDDREEKESLYNVSFPRANEQEKLTHETAKN